MRYNKHRRPGHAVDKTVKLRTVQRGSIAQLGEHLPYKQRVTGSSPVVPTMWPGSSVG